MIPVDNYPLRNVESLNVQAPDHGHLHRKHVLIAHCRETAEAMVKVPSQDLLFSF